MARDYDIVLFGATGYVGELTAEYLVRNAPMGARLAIAGRDAAKLEALRQRLGRSEGGAVESGDAEDGRPQPVRPVSAGSESADPEPGRLELGLLVADAGNKQQVAALAGAARVVISTVGPYMRYGEPLVAACASAGTDYVDLTGESEFVDLVYLRHHATAKQSGARLVHSCGFDSIPYDLGALFTVAQLPADVPIALQGFGATSGAISGGTFHSAVEQFGRLKESGRVARQRRSVEHNAADGQIAAGRSVRGIPGRPHNERLAGGWVVPVPTVDPKNVLRSARLNPAYGPDFSYSHYIVTRRLTTTVGLGLGVGAVMTLAQLETTRKLVLRLRSPGSGPSPERRARSFFRIRFVADYGSSEPRGRLITEVSGGDPGYGETAKMLAESALALAFEEDLPQCGGGQWTPALALGQPLIDRLERAGIEFRVVDGPAVRG